MISIKEDDVYAALGQFILNVCPVIQVVRGQANRVPMPKADNIAVMQSTGRRAMSTVKRDYFPPDPAQPDGSNVGVIATSVSTELQFQVDIYGVQSAENAQWLSTFFRDTRGTEFFEPTGIAPLYCDDPVQMPLISGEDQWIERWMVTCRLGANIMVAAQVEYADSLITTLSEITHGI